MFLHLLSKLICFVVANINFTVVHRKMKASRVILIFRKAVECELCFLENKSP